jgi:thymidylate kinase
VHLVASWFHAVSDCVVRPLLEQDRLVLVDNWIHKGLARLRLNTAIEYDYVESFFTRACLPDLVVMLDVTPQMAAARKAVFTAIEAGNLYSDIGINRTNFIRYQEGLRGQLDRFAERDSWALVPTEGCDIEQVGQGIAEAVLKALD